MKDEPIKRYSLSEQVAEKIEKMIENNTYKINERIPTEVELIEKFNVSRNTIREAIRSLVSVGILEVLQGDGTYVRANNRFDATISKQLREANYNDINETRITLEISIAIYAAKRRTEEDLENIHQALLNRQEFKADEKENTLADVNFHMEIAKASHNKLLIALYKSLYSFLIDNVEKRKKKTLLSNHEIDQLHIDLFEAIKNRDAHSANDISRKILLI